jgi:hypothetical protein
MKLTQDRIDDLECPAGKKDALVFDDEQRGLGVRMTQGARRAPRPGSPILPNTHSTGQSDASLLARSRQSS